jgi:ribonuclease T2
MKNITPKSLAKLSTDQLLLILALLAAFALYQYWSQQQSAASNSPDATPVVVIQIPPTSVPEQPEDTKPAPTSTRLSVPTVTRSSALTATPVKVISPTLTPLKATVSTQGMSEFDFFVLALSWSPDYCASSGGDDPQQCAVGKKLGFVLHGLWPQYDQGYPSNCSLEKLTQSVKAQFPDLYPSDSLYDHEWEKHGTCTGLPAKSYLALSKQIKESVVIPAAFRAPTTAFKTNPAKIRKDFVQANPGFSDSAFAVNCSSSGRYLKELYVCFSKDGKPLACSVEVYKDAVKSCPGELTVRNTQ